MIIVKLQGGLGNQMFQYALGRNLSLLHNIPLKIDSSYLHKPNQSARTLQLDGFNITLSEATDLEIQHYTSLLQKALDRLRPFGKRRYLKEESWRFDPRILEVRDAFLEGHWVSEQYFLKNEDVIKNNFRLKHPLSKAAQEIAIRISTEKMPVSLHIRRGDYVSIQKIRDTHGVLSLSYYQEAAKLLTEKFPESHFFVFSDDPEWAKKEFTLGYPCTLVSGKEIPDYEELTLMSLCKNHIIANSTFSWWGAWLSKYKEKIVLAPKLWMLDKTKDTRDFLPPSWIQI